MKKSTLVTAIASLIAYILLVINTVSGTDFALPADVLSSIAVLLATLIMWVISNWFNQDYTLIARKSTPVMRKIKKLVNEGDLSLLDAIEHLLEEWGDENDEDD